VCMVRLLTKSHGVCLFCLLISSFITLFLSSDLPPGDLPLFSLFICVYFPFVCIPTNSSLISYALCTLLFFLYFPYFLHSSPNIIHRGAECNILLCSECMSDKETPICPILAAGKSPTCPCLLNECWEC
jgi:hypothetical protein